MDKLLVVARDWLDHIQSVPSHPMNLMAVAEIDNPSRAAASREYLAAAKKASTDSSSPQTMFDGIQTTIDLCRVHSGYDPLDPAAGGKGDSAYFSTFTKEVAAVPFLSLNTVKRMEIKQESRDVNALIDSFVAAFDGVMKEDVDAMKKSLSELAKAALSYSNEEQKQSNFSQNFLQLSNDAVTFYLYWSVFTIQTTKNKGCIQYKSSYDLRQAEYRLSLSNWNAVKDSFGTILKTSTTDWLSAMTSPKKPNSTVTASCLEAIV